MSDTPQLKASLGPHLPHLRRYGRALTGSQTSGDAFVRAALEALLAAPDQFQTGNTPRVELFRLFHKIWSSVADSVSDAPANWPSVSQVVGESLLSSLSRARREALLLTAVEGFSVAEASLILDQDADQIRTSIALARAEITRQLAGRVLIIEDEPVIAMHLQDLVEAMGHTVVGIASTHGEAVQLSSEHDTDLVLADIRLADGSSGLDAVKDILAQHTVPVVFITAFPERLLTGERPEPTYLITKPFEDETVIATIGQALMMHREGEAQTA